MSFGLDAELPLYWAVSSKFMTHWHNALSTVFPEGEKFFIDSVRNFEAQIRDPALREQVRGFVGQEGHHTYQHRLLNEIGARNGADPAKYEGRLKHFLDFVRRAPPLWQLGVTCALEHFTAIMSHQLLSDDALMADVHPKVAALWRWHAIEETEHKAVCFDVFQSVGGGYYTRVMSMFSATLMFFPIVFATQTGLMLQDRTRSSVKDVLRGLYLVWGKPGPLRRMLPDYFRYYLPRFHPWQQDNSAFVSKWKAEQAHEPPPSPAA